MVHTTSVSIIDIMPTVLEALQIEPLPLMEGESLLPMLNGEKRAHRRVFSERRSFEKAPKLYLVGEAYSNPSLGRHRSKPTKKLLNAFVR